MKKIFCTGGILCALLLGTAVPAGIAVPVISIPPSVGEGALSTVPFAIDVHLEQISFAAHKLSGDIHVVADRAAENITRITFFSPSLKIDTAVIDPVRGEFLLNSREGILIVKTLGLGDFRFNGKINLAKQELDLSGEFGEIPLENILTALSGTSSALAGKAAGKVRIQGAWDSLSYKGCVRMHDGVLKGFPFNEALFNFAGTYPYCALTNSYVENNEARYALEGMFGIEDLADMEKMYLSVSPEKLVIDGWTVSQGKGAEADTVNFSKHDGSAFTVGFGRAGDNARDTEHSDMEFKKALGLDTFLKLKIQNSTSSLLVGKQVEF